jgi:GTPase
MSHDDTENVIKLSRECEDGNIEYKLKLIGKDTTRIEKLASQMRYRCEEAGGEAIYMLGVSDDGSVEGITDEEYVESIKALTLCANKSNYSLTMLTSKLVGGKNEKKRIYEILVRENNIRSYIDIKVCITGSVDAGKSTTCSSLTTGVKDNGRGSGRLAIFNYKHEVDSGRTSSVAHHILGFNDKGDVVNYKEYENDHSQRSKLLWPDIIRESKKVVSFYDLCGHEKYLKTTILGLTSQYPDMCLVMVGANMGLNKITQEHIFLCKTLHIPFAIVITKIDFVKDKANVLEKTVENINKMLRMPVLNRIPYKVNTLDDVITCAKNIHSESITPIFHISNVTGEGLPWLRQFLNLLSKSPSNIVTDGLGVEYHVDNIFSVTGVGTVVGGQLRQGTVSVGDKLMFGPINTSHGNSYEQLEVKSIHCKRVNLQTVKAGSYVCIGLKKIDRDFIKRGYVLLSLGSEELSVTEFEADVTVLKSHSTTVKIGYSPSINTGCTRQVASIISITNKVSGRVSSDAIDESNLLRSGDKATLRFKFRYHPEYLKIGANLLLSEGKIKIIGTVTKIN